MRGILLGLLVSGAVGAENLLANGSFEFGHGSGGNAEAWSHRSNERFVAERTTDQPRGGRFAFRLSVADDLAVNWYQIGQELGAPRARQSLTLSGWVRTRNVRDGAGAYLSLNFFDAGGKRTGYFDSKTVQGTNEYVRLAVTGVPPPGSSVMRALMLIHGHGEAVFDELQLEAGESATPFAPSPRDAARAERQARNQATAEAVRRRSGYRREPGRNVAVLAEPLPTEGRPTAPADIAAALSPAGFVVTELSGEELSNEALLSPEVFDLLVLPWGEAFPAAARDALVDYLARGGSFLSLGGYAFDRPLVKSGEQWCSPESLPIPEGRPMAIVDEFTTARPVATADGGDHALQVGAREAPGADGLALRLATPAMKQYATWSMPVAPGALPPDWSVTRLRARADREATHLIVEWTEQDGSRWQKVLSLSPEWREYVIPAADLAYWVDNPSVGRGGPTDRFNPANARGMLFGFSVANERDGAALGVDIDYVRVHDDPLAALRAAPPRINTHYGPIRDAMHPAPEQIGVFDPSHPLLQVTAARAAPDQAVVAPGTELSGPLSGLAATCVLGLNGHGFSANRCRLVPLVTTDADGQPRGAALSIAYHYSGLFRGSAWAFCGVDNRDLFGRGQPLGASLPRLAEALTARIFLHEADAEYACYRPGETMEVRCSVSDLGSRPATTQVRLLVDGKPFATSETALAAGETRPLRWQVPVTDALAFVPLRFELLRGEEVVDAIDNGVVVWRDADVRRGPAVAVRDSLLTFRGQPRFLVGSQMWWGQVESVTARSPLQWRRDFEQMQRLGFHIARDFLRMNTEQERRISDAVVALAAAHDVVMIHTPNLAPSAATEERRRQPEIASEIARRYRGVPNLVVDLCNEPRVSPDLPDLLGPWNEFLKREYGGDAALRAAWGARAPAQPLGEVPLPRYLDNWSDRATADLQRFLAESNRAWSGELQERIHTLDPQRLVTVGFLPGHGWADTLVIPHDGSLDLDFSNRHFYGDVFGFPAQMGWIDLRLLGKPSSIGEFGARNHPGFGDLYEDTARYNHRHEYVVAHAFGMGGSFACSWHWRDPMEGIFPFGQVHADNVPRPVAARMAAMAKSFGELDRSGELPRLALVLPTRHLLGGQRRQVIAGVSRAMETLLGLHVPFAVIADVSLTALPTSVTQLIAPIPYVLEDESFDALLGFVKRGGALALTGDLRYAPSRQPAARDRLRELCGVAAGPAASPLDPSGATVSTVFGPLHASGVYEPIEARVAGPLVFDQTLGEGRVRFLAAPVELEPERELTARAYAELVAWLGAERLVVTPDLPEIHAFPIPLRSGGRSYLVWNEGPAREIVVGSGAATRKAMVGERTWALL